MNEFVVNEKQRRVRLMAGGFPAAKRTAYVFATEAGRRNKLEAENVVL